MPQHSLCAPCSMAKAVAASVTAACMQAMHQAVHMLQNLSHLEASTCSDLPDAAGGIECG